MRRPLRHTGHSLAADDLDLDDRWVHVTRQIKRVRSRLVYGLAK
jgi:hypothetical protein